KAGLIGFTKTVAREMASRNITCNAVAPGFVPTDLTNSLIGQMEATILKQIPLGRFGTVEDVAHAIAFLVSEGASYITGQVLQVLSVFAVIAILYYYRQIANQSALIAGTLGMQLGGAFGNLVDRVGQGYVVDFVDVGIPNGPRFWAFNVADSSIVLGILFVTVLLYAQDRKTSARAT